MSSKTQTDQSSTNTLNYDPSSLANYKGLTGAGSSLLQSFMSNPFGNANYTQGLQNSMKGAQAGANNNMSVLQQMMKTSGMSGTAGQGFQQAQAARMGRANQGMLANANISNVQAALQRQLQATGMGMAFQPLLKGTSGNSQTTQTTGGLGTWLPQLIGAGLGMAGGAMTGGMSGAMGSIMKGGSNFATGGSSLGTGANIAPSGSMGFGSVPGSTGFAPPPAWMTQ
jgi:hypothetical protein